MFTTEKLGRMGRVDSEAKKRRKRWVDSVKAKFRLIQGFTFYTLTR